MGPDPQRRVEDSPSGLWAVAAHRLGLARLPDRRRRGGPGAGRPQGARPHDGRPAVGAPRQRRHRQAPHDEGAGAGPGLGAMLWERTAYEGPVFDHRHRRGSYAAPTMVTDGAMVVAYFGPEGLYGYDIDGNLKWKADVGKFPLLGHGHRHLAGAVREPGHHPARRERGQAVAAAGLRHQDRQGGVAHAARRSRPAGPRRSS